ncbi:MAG TPA: c-type cytochrome [Deltaproteobacteria bacterium]|nr:c-type cytochrome [Deltaproteobacteria bacterium]
MKKLLWFVFVTGFLFLSAVISADEGESIFKSNGCGACHKPETSPAGRPSLKEISKAYHGKEKQLDTYFKGKSEPIINPEKASTMKRYIEKTKALSDADRKLLVDHLLKH